MRSLLVALAALLLAAPAVAQERHLAVLELKNKLAGHARSQLDASYFTDQIRQAALPIARAHAIGLISRENLLTLLKAAGKTLEGCEGECEVDTGRNVGAEFVISGDLVQVGNTFKASLRFHDTRSGNLLSAVTASGKSAEELDQSLAKKVRELLAELKDEPAPRAATTLAPVASRPIRGASLRLLSSPYPTVRLLVHPRSACGSTAGLGPPK